MKVKKLSYKDDLTKGKPVEKRYFYDDIIKDTDPLIQQLSKGANVHLHEATDYENGVHSIKVTVFMLHKTLEDRSSEDDKAILDRTKSKGNLDEGILNDYPLVPEHDIDDEARDVAVSWCKEGTSMITKMELASDFMNYARRLQVKRGVQALAIANKYAAGFNDEAKVKHLATEVVELALGLEKKDQANIQEEIGDCLFLLLHILSRHNPKNLSLYDLIEVAAKKMETRFNNADTQENPEESSEGLHCKVHGDTNNKLKASQIIKGLQAMIEAYGDLPVSITFAMKKEHIIDTDDKSLVISSEEIHICYDQHDVMDGGDEINIRNFIY